MTHFDDAKALVEHSKAALVRVRSTYDQSLHEHQVSPTLLVEIKSLMENIRSALDFAAGALFAKYGNAKPNAKVYFPYALATQTAAQFRASNRIDVCIPGLLASRPDIVAVLESFQHFGGSEWTWVPTFMELNNENKHQRLTPQIRKETRQLKISSSGGASIVMGGGASISLGRGASIRMGGTVIPGGQKISADKPGVVIGGTQEVTVWVSFHFSTNDAPVLPLLEQAVQGAERIVQTLTGL